MGSVGCQEHEEIVQTFEEKDEVGASGEEGFRKSGRRLSRAGVPSRLSNSSRAKTRVPASEVDHSRSSAQFPLPTTAQPPNSHGSQVLSCSQAIDLRGAESQTGQGDAAHSSSQIASLALFF
jgi:hypothetical protein